MLGLFCQLVKLNNSFFNLIFHRRFHLKVLIMVNGWVVMDISKAIDSYRIAYNSDNQQTIPKMSAFIDLNGKDNKMIGTLRFVEEFPLPRNIINEDGTFEVFYHLDRFNDIITILRYEKPLWFHLDDHFKSVQIQALHEPVGEE